MSREILIGNNQKQTYYVVDIDGNNIDVIHKITKVRVNGHANDFPTHLRLRSYMSFRNNHILDVWRIDDDKGERKPQEGDYATLIDLLVYNEDILKSFDSDYKGPYLIIQNARQEREKRKRDMFKALKS